MPDTEEMSAPNPEDKDEDQFGTCIAHPMASEDDCEHCNAELARRQQWLEQLMTDNNRRLQKVQKESGIAIDPNSILSMRLDLFIRMTLPNMRHRFFFEQQFHVEIADVIENLEKEAARQKLLSGVPNLGNKIRAPKRG